MSLELQLVDVEDRINRDWLMEWITAIGADQWPIKVIVADARHKREIYMQEYDGEYPGDMAFRAYVDYNKPQGITVIAVFMDRAETPNSILWLVVHELAHYNIWAPIPDQWSPLGYYFALKRDQWLKSQGITPEEYVANVKLRTRDDMHEAEPEEAFVNDVATTIVGERYDRAWWRARWREIEEAA